MPFVQKKLPTMHDRFKFLQKKVSNRRKLMEPICDQFFFCILAQIRCACIAIWPIWGWAALIKGRRNKSCLWFCASHAFVFCWIGPNVRRLEQRGLCYVVLRTCVKMSVLIRGMCILYVLQCGSGSSGRHHQFSS